MIFHAPPLLQYLNHCFPLPALYPHFHLFKTCISLSEFFPICSPISQVKKYWFTVLYYLLYANIIEKSNKKKKPKALFLYSSKDFAPLFLYCTAKRLAVRLRKPHTAKRQFSFMRLCAYCNTKRQFFWCLVLQLLLLIIYLNYIS